MTLPYLDSAGNLHRAPGTPGALGGQFAPKPVSAPAAALHTDAEALRARVRIRWRELFNPANYLAPIQLPSQSRKERDRRLPAEENSSVPGARERIRETFASVSVPMYTSLQAPISITVEGASDRSDIAREYREVDGRLFRQVWSNEPGPSGPSPEPDVDDHGWAPTVRGRVYQLRPVPADAAWLRQEAERMPPAAATTVEGAHAAVQEHLDQFAAIDGNVWQAAPEPVYRAPVPQDAPFDAPLELEVIPAPDTTSSAAPLNIFPGDRYDDALRTLEDTAGATGAPVAPAPDEPPIMWLRELGLIDAPAYEPNWRAGAALTIVPGTELTEATFQSSFGDFRAQISGIPGAVAGDVSAFRSPSSWRLDFAALTASQQQEYRAYIAFGVEHGFI